MKKIDIENLERKTPYEVPEDFFATMQENVLLETKERKFIIGKYAQRWIAAAAIILIAGITFFLIPKKNQFEKESQTTTTTLAQQKVENTRKLNSQDLNAELPHLQPLDSQKTEEINRGNNLKNKKEERTKSLANHPSVSTQSLARSEENLDKALENLNAQEIASINASYEMDAYLELY